MRPKIYPELEAGLVYLDDSSQIPQSLYPLVLDKLREHRGIVWWLDARNTAVTTALYEEANAVERLSSIRIARAFTAYQHHALVRELPSQVSSRTAFAVAPNVVDLYRDDDVPDYETDKLATATLSILANLGESLEIPIITTSLRDDSLASKVANFATQEIACRETRMGLFFESDDFETDLYWKDEYIQTTIPYWVQLVGSVERSAVSAHQTPTVGITI